MIRFSCRKCGKSLRAGESIVGKKTKCTNCNAVNRVPLESTRNSGEKPRRDSAKNLPQSPTDSLEQEIAATLLADQDSNEGFEDFDFSRLLIEPGAGKKNNLNPESKSFSASSVLSAEANQRSSKSPSSGHAREVSPSTVSAPMPFSPSKASREQLRINWKWLGVIGMIILAGSMLYGIVNIWKGRKAEIVKTSIELSPIGAKYAEAVFQLKKVERMMTYMENGFLEKKLPKAELASVHETRTRFQSVLNDADLKKDANQLFEKGEKDAAEKLLIDRIEQMATIKKDIEKQTARLTARVYN